jgi:hypothetical protein
MPGTPVGVEFSIGRPGQGQVDHAAVLAAGRPIHRRPNKRVAKHDPFADRQQPVRLRGGRSSRCDAEALRCAPQQEWIPERLRCRYQQEKARFVS